MFLLEKAFNRLRFKIRLDIEKGKPSSGYLPSKVRKEALKLCKDICKNKGGNLLEVGCGEGLFLTGLAKNFPNLNIVGIDSSSQIINESQLAIKKLKFNNVRLICAKADKLPFRDDFFDIVVCINTIYNLPPKDLLSVFKEIVRICKRQADFIFDIRNKLNFLVYLGYKLARCYDPFCPQYLIPHRFKKIAEILNKLNYRILNKLPIGFPFNTFAPAILIEAKKLNC